MRLADQDYKDEVFPVPLGTSHSMEFHVLIFKQMDFLRVKKVEMELRIDNFHGPLWKWI